MLWKRHFCHPKALFCSSQSYSFLFSCCEITAEKTWCSKGALGGCQGKIWAWQMWWIHFFFVFYTTFSLCSGGLPAACVHFPQSLIVSLIRLAAELKAANIEGEKVQHRERKDSKGGRSLQIGREVIKSFLANPLELPFIKQSSSSSSSCFSFCFFHSTINSILIPVLQAYLHPPLLFPWLPNDLINTQKSWRIFLITSFSYFLFKQDYSLPTS